MPSKTDRREALFAVFFTIIYNGHGLALEYPWSVEEIQAVLTEIGPPFSLVPFEPHSNSVPTRSSYVNCPIIDVIVAMLGDKFLASE